MAAQEKNNSPQERSIQPRSKLSEAMIIALIGLVGTIIAGLLGSPLIEKWAGSAPVPTALANDAPITSVSPPLGQTEISPPSTMPDKNTGSTATAFAAEITDTKGVEMVLVPLGEFTMGSNDGDEDEKPAHTVYLYHYYIDKYEVTNASYKVCVDAGACGLPNPATDYNDSRYGQHPVVFVGWNNASEYCKWRDARLPTEAEWEKAARGTDARSYPWGEGINNTYANYDLYTGNTTPVGKYESGKSTYGAYDMAGNVWEWVADWYDGSYYSVSPTSGPLGPREGENRVVRGGAFDRDEAMVSTFSRTWLPPTATNSTVGFRCASKVNPYP